MNDLRDNLEAKRCSTEASETENQIPCIENPPGLSTVAYRIGTQPSFFARMRERLGTWALPDDSGAPGSRPLADLDGGVDDPAVAVLDTWAVTADIVTFYQERIANEMFLRTASEPRSVLELARLVGQTPGPGVAAGAFLAFNVETAPGAPLEALVPVGTQVVSIPGQDELPQTFETQEAIVARSAWNELRPRIGEPQDDLSAARELFLAGLETALEPGDLLLVMDETVTQAAVARVLAVETDEAVGHTRVTLQEDIASFRYGADAPVGVALSPALALDGDLRAADVRVFALREQVSFFGHNAPRYGSLPREEFVKDDPFTTADPANDWDQGRTVWTDSRGVSLTRSAGDAADAAAVFLSQRLDDVIPGGWVVLVGSTLEAEDPVVAAGPDVSFGEEQEDPAQGTSTVDSSAALGATTPDADGIGADGAGADGSRHAEARIYRVTGTTTASLADYALSGESTGLALTQADGSPLAADVLERVAFDVRRTSAFLVSEPLALAERPITEPFPSPERDGEGAFLVLDRTIDGLRSGQILSLRGTRVDGGGEASRIVELRAVDQTSVPGLTTLIIQQASDSERLERDTIVLNANVARATHGETVQEVLGSGDAGVAAQSFRLQRAPLTYDSAPVPGGVESSLRLRVDGVLWQEVGTLHDQGPEAQVYTVEVDGEGQATVRFGDGEEGARLPTGEENVTAVYRIGIGTDGAVAAGSLSLLTTRPLGIAEVGNPLPAAGAAPQDDVERVRRVAPVTARTLGRIVSLSDFEDFAIAFTGIGKVRAAALGGVHLTVAGVDGAAVENGSVLFDHFLEAVEAARLPGPPLRLSSFEHLTFDLTAKLVIDPRFRADDVFDQVRAKLRADYAFDRRELAMPLYTSEVVTAIQSVAGVVAVDLDAIHRSEFEPTRPARLDALPARMRGPNLLPAQLLSINPDGITLGVRTP